MYNAPLPWQPQHGGHIGNMMGCEHPSFIQIGPLVGEVNYAVRLPCQNLVSIRYSPPEILRFYNFATLTEKCLTTPPFGGFEPLNIMGGHSNPQKAHPWVTTRHLSHKWLNSVQGSTWAELREKKYNQDF